MIPSNTVINCLLITPEEIASLKTAEGNIQLDNELITFE
jgi:hypothetical protein